MGTPFRRKGSENVSTRQESITVSQDTAKRKPEGIPVSWRSGSGGIPGHLFMVAAKIHPSILFLPNSDTSAMAFGDDRSVIDRTSNASYFFFACLANTLFLAIFLRRFGNFVAGFLGIRFSVMRRLPYDLSASGQVHSIRLRDNFFRLLICACGPLAPVVKNKLIGRSCRN